jgi:Putative addiction module component.
MNKKIKTIELNKYEKEILDAFEKGELKPSLSKTNYQEIARNTLKKNRKINIRIPQNDLSSIQKRPTRDPEIDREWVEIAQRRSIEIKKGKVKPVSGEKVFRKIQDRFKK